MALFSVLIRIRVVFVALRGRLVQRQNVNERMRYRDISKQFLDHEGGVFFERCINCFILLFSSSWKYLD
jgi:hypothetical protein